MPLASRAVDAIFARMLVRYGTAWVSKWAGVPTDALKADWAEQLDGLSSGAIRYGLEYLPLDRPPNAAQFKALCHERPEQLPKLLPAPPADPARVQAALAAITRPGRRDPKACAHRLRDIELHHNGIQPIEPLRPVQEIERRRMTITQRTMWRAALRNSGADSE